MPPEDVLDCQNAIVPLGAGRNDNGGFLASGSAVLISRQIALTAKHVLVDYHQKAEYGEPLSGGQHVEVHFSIELGSGFGGGTWRDSVDWCATADGHDIALLRLRGTSGDFPAYPEIDVVPPRIGDPAPAPPPPPAGRAGAASPPSPPLPVGGLAAWPGGRGPAPPARSSGGAGGGETPPRGGVFGGFFPPPPPPVFPLGGGGGKEESGGAERDRTVDLLNAIQALSQLSYSPTRVRRERER